MPTSINALLLREAPMSFDRSALLEPPARGFEVTEFEQRLHRVQQQMAIERLDLLMLTTEAEVRYFSGFQTQFWQSPTRPWFLLVPAAGKPVAVIPEIGAACMGATWIEEIRTWSSPHPDDDGISLVRESIWALAGTNARIGIPKGRETHLRMPLGDFQTLTASLADCETVDATAIVHGLRSVKSTAEVAKIQHAAQIACQAFDEVGDWICEGMSEIEIFRQFKLSCLQHGADEVAYLVGGAGAGGYGDIISPPTERVLRSGDVLILDVGCVWDGYYCDFDRNFAVRDVCESVARAHERVWDATEAGLKAARVGATCAELFSAMDAMLSLDPTRAQGTVGRLGHGLGMQLTEFPSLAAFDHTLLKDGMVLTLEPGCEFAPAKMMVHEENIVVGAAGPTLLTRRAPRTIPVVG